MTLLSRAASPAMLGVLLLSFVAAMAAAAPSLAPALGLVALVAGSAFVVAFLTAPKVVVLGTWALVAFQQPLASIAGEGSSLSKAILRADEPILVAMLALTVLQWCLGHWRRPPQVLMVASALVVLAGVLSGWLQGAPLTVTAVGGVLLLKFFVVLLATLSLDWSADDVQRATGGFIAFGLLVAAVGVVDRIAPDTVRSILNNADARYVVDAGRAGSVRSIFPHPGRFAFAMALVFAVVCARYFVFRRRVDLWLSIVFLVSTLMSLRVKGFLGVAGAMLVIVLVGETRLPNRVLRAMGVILLVVLLGATVVRPVLERQVDAYVSSEGSVRGLLYRTSGEIAADSFPLGEGFGRYGSYTSAEYYSPVYKEYGLHRIYGLQEERSQYITDTSWPAILGETGVAGTIAYAVGLGALVLALVRMRVSSAHGRFLRLAVLAALAAAGLDALANPTLFDSFGVLTVGIMVAMALRVAPSAPAPAVDGARAKGVPFGSSVPSVR